MPKSKREKVVHLTRVEKKTKDHKRETIDQIKECIDTWRFVYVLSIENMRNSFLKSIREDWKGRARLFWGKNKVIRRALGTSAEDEYLVNSRQVGAELAGNRGLMFTDAAPEEVQSYFQQFERTDYARGGWRAGETIVLPAGRVRLLIDGLPDDESYLPASLEGQLRQLGVPSILKNGQVLLGGQFTVCREGERLTHEQARLLKMLQKPMAVFKVDLIGAYDKDSKEFSLFSLPDAQMA